MLLLNSNLIKNLYYGEIMKRILKILTCVTLVLVMLLSGCSCVMAIPLSFSSAFFENGTPKNGFVETLTYKVAYVNGDDTNYPYLKKSDMLNNVILDVQVDDASEYKTTLTLLLSNANVPELADSNLLGENGLTSSSGYVFHLSTTLNYKAKLIFNGENSHEIEDKIQNDVYFLMKDNSYAPIFARSVSKMNLISVNETGINIGKVEYNYQTLYQMEDYSIWGSITSFGGSTYSISTGEKVDESNQTQTQEIEKQDYEYSIKTIIDNTQLLFALRNFSTTPSQTSGLSVVAPAYGEAKTLAIRHDTSMNRALDFTFNGNSAKENEILPVKKLSYAINDMDNSGQTQYLVYQSAKSDKDTVNSRALLVEYAFPMPVYGSMTCLGGLKCSLTSVEVNQ